MPIRALYVRVVPYTAFDYLSVAGNDYTNLLFTTYSKGYLAVTRASKVSSAAPIDFAAVMNRVIYKFAGDIRPCLYYKEKKVSRIFYFQVQDRRFRKSNIVRRQMNFDTCKSPLP